MTLQTLELLWMKRVFQPKGIWREAVLAEEYKIFPPLMSALFQFLFHYRFFVLILLARLLAGFILPFSIHPAITLTLFTSTWVIGLRFRGVFNGGSDYMSLIILSGLCFADLFHEVAWAQTAALLYIAVQSLASYVIGGWVKIKDPQWRNGSALIFFLNTPSFCVPEKLKRRISISISAALSWGIMLFEMGFPALLFFPGLRIPILSLGVLFHLLNVYGLGLNRFFWIWIATYPSIYFMSEYLARH